MLILTDQRRLSFKRTHALHELKSPEETMVDVIAGEFAYYAPMVLPYTKGALNFEAIDSAREALCPEGSYQSALIGLVRAWPTPCVLVEARWAGKKQPFLVRISRGFLFGLSARLSMTQPVCGECNSIRTSASLNGP